MLDCYGANERQLDDVKLVNEVLNKLVYILKINPIEPPHLLPYYYGSVKEDIGVSGKVLLLGGHVTIHTFPLRACYFVDIFYDGNFDEKDVYDFFTDELPYNKKTSNFVFINDNAEKTHRTESSFDFCIDNCNLFLYLSGLSDVYEFGETVWGDCFGCNRTSHNTGLGQLYVCY